MAKKSYRAAATGTGWRALALFLALVVILGAGYAIGYGITGKVNPVDWTKKEQSGNDDGGDKTKEVKADGMSIEVEDCGENALMTMSIMALNEEGIEVEESTSNSFELIVQILPENATIQQVNVRSDWEAVELGGWEYGKNVKDYVQITKSEDNDLKYYVICSEPFAKPIVITVTTKDGTELSSTCVCNYIKRIERIDLKVSPSYMGSDNGGFDTAIDKGPYIIYMYSEIGSPGSGGITTSVTYGIGTKEEDITVTTDYCLTDSYYRVMETKGYPVIERYYSGIVRVFNQGSYGVEQMFGQNFYNDPSYASAVISTLSTIYVSAVDINIYAKGTYNDYKKTYSVALNTSNMKVKASSVNVTPSIDF